jgi:hypothetical protein
MKLYTERMSGEAKLSLEQAVLSQEEMHHLRSGWSRSLLDCNIMNVLTVSVARALQRRSVQSKEVWQQCGMQLGVCVGGGGVVGWGWGGHKRHGGPVICSKAQAHPATVAGGAGGEGGGMGGLGGSGGGDTKATAEWDWKQHKWRMPSRLGSSSSQPHVCMHRTWLPAYRACLPAPTSRHAPGSRVNASPSSKPSNP